MSDPIIIIGAGLAGYQVAREFRKLDQTTPLTLITADGGHFYPKPQLSNALTSGKTSATLSTANANSMASQLNATILTHSRVRLLDPLQKKLMVGEDTLAFSQLVIACGAKTITPPVVGSASTEIKAINHLDDFAHYEQLIQGKRHIAILGAGLIGCEFANDLSNAKYDVQVIAPAASPLELLIPPEIGALLQQALTANGVKFHLGTVATRVDKQGAGLVVTLDNGSVLNVDLVISAIGLKPQIDLALTAGLKTNRGIVVNRYLETSAAGIYALGDCAEVEGYVLQYIAPILQCARALAKTLAGERTAVDYPAMPVVIKTPAYPIVVCPPPPGMAGRWEIEYSANAARALFYNERRELNGFVLTQEAVKERMTLAKQLPGLLSQT